MRIDVEQDMHPGLHPFVQVVRGLSAILGDGCEILLHDVSRLERSIVVCANGHITGRPLGSPMSGYGLELLNSDVFSNGNDSHIYMAHANNGNFIKCGVICLRDEMKNIIGLICIHFDTAKALAARELLDGMFFMPDYPVREPVNEFFGLEIEDVFRNTLHEVINSLEKPLGGMSKADGVEIVRTLMDRGFFMMKGAVDYAARELGKSKFTIYAYMREAGKNSRRSM
jgi:predicted transcriptional regulator YheO